MSETNRQCGKQPDANPELQQELYETLTAVCDLFTANQMEALFGVDLAHDICVVLSKVEGSFDKIMAAVNAVEGSRS
jgi:hypothetical protein